MTVSTSALSKLSTTKRPRCAAGTSGAIDGAAGGRGGASTRGGGSGGASTRGPTEAGGTRGNGSGGGGAGGGGVSVADGAGGRAGRTGAAQPARSVMRQTAAVVRFTLLRWLRRLLDALARRGQGETAPQTRRGTPTGYERAEPRSLHLRHGLLRRHAARRDHNPLHARLPTRLPTRLGHGRNPAPLRL